VNRCIVYVNKCSQLSGIASIHYPIYDAHMNYIFPGYEKFSMELRLKNNIMSVYVMAR